MGNAAEILLYIKVCVSAVVWGSAIVYVLVVLRRGSVDR